MSVNIMRSEDFRTGSESSLYVSTVLWPYFYYRQKLRTRNYLDSFIINCGCCCPQITPSTHKTQPSLQSISSRVDYNEWYVIEFDWRRSGNWWYKQEPYNKTCSITVPFPAGKVAQNIDNAFSPPHNLKTNCQSGCKVAQLGKHWLVCVCV